MTTRVVIAGKDQFNQAGSVVRPRASEWNVYHAPAATTQATITRTGVSGQRHYVTHIVVATDDVGEYVELLDGAITLLSVFVGVTGVVVIPLPHPIRCDIGNSVTLRFSAAPAAGKFQSVAMGGYTE